MHGLRRQDPDLSRPRPAWQVGDAIIRNTRPAVSHLRSSTVLPVDCARGEEERLGHVWERWCGRERPYVAQRQFRAEAGTFDVDSKTAIHKRRWSVLKILVRIVGTLIVSGVAALLASPSAAAHVDAILEGGDQGRRV